MGYTHYWNAGDESKWLAAWPQVLECTKKILQAAKESGNKITGPSGKGEPIVEDANIILNGNPSHETFWLNKKLSRFECTKTEMKPYDEVVTAILLCAAVLGGDGIKVSSDGNWEEWIEGREMVQKLFPDFTDKLSPKLINDIDYDSE